MQRPSQSRVTVKNVFVALFLTAIILLSSLDSFGIDGVLPLLQKHFNINGAETAMIQTISSVVRTGTFALMCIFGGVFERRKLYMASVSLWIIMSLLSIILGSESFMIFVAFRSLAAVGSAVFQVLSNVLMADIFTDRSLGVALMCMTACDMVSGFTISAIFSSFIISGSYPWQTGLIPGPLIALIPLAGFACLMEKDKHHQISVKNSIRTDSFKMFSKKSFVFMTTALSIGASYSSGYVFWIPSVTLSAWTAYPSAFYGLSYPSITALNSIISLAGTFIGMSLVLWIAQSWHYGTGFCLQRSNAKAYPIVVMIGCFLNSIMMILDMITINKNCIVRMIPLFISAISTSPEICLVPLMTMMVLSKNSRAPAMALGRLFGGVLRIPSAQIIGFLSDIIRGNSMLEADRFHSYQLAMLSFSAILFVSVFCYGITVKYFGRVCNNTEAQDDIEKLEEMQKNGPL